MAGVDILKALFDEKKIRILQVFIQKTGESLTQKEIVRRSRVPLATTHRILGLLGELGIIEREQHKHLTTYTLADTEGARYLTELLYERPAPIEQFVNAISQVAGVQQIILQGSASESRANVVIVGPGIERASVNSVVADIRERLGFTFSHLILEPEQFAMLETMGQFSGNRTILYQK